MYTWTNTKGCNGFDKLPKTMAIIYSYPSPHSGCHQGLVVVVVTVTMTMMIHASNLETNSVRHIKGTHKTCWVKACLLNRRNKSTVYSHGFLYKSFRPPAVFPPLSRTARDSWG